MCLNSGLKKLEYCSCIHGKKLYKKDMEKIKKVTTPKRITHPEGEGIAEGF
jgi:hypothetical protein